MIRLSFGNDSTKMKLTGNDVNSIRQALSFHQESRSSFGAFILIHIIKTKNKDGVGPVFHKFYRFFIVIGFIEGNLLLLNLTCNNVYNFGTRIL
jgi:hypothetical protein